MSHITITSLTPPRARTGDSLVLTGAGFAASGNTVEVDGVSAAVGAESTTSITVTVPVGIRTDRFVPVEVTHATDLSTSTRQWWSKATKVALQSFLLALQKPSQFEDWGAASSLEHPADIEAKDIEALHELLQYLPTDVLQVPGDMVGRNTNGVGRVTGGAVGSTVMLDRATTGGASGINHRTRRAGVLTWGGATEDLSPILLGPHVTADVVDQVAPEQRSPNGGKAVVLVVYIDAVTAPSSLLDRVELLRNGAVVYDSAAGLALGAQAMHVRNVFDDLGDVATTDRFSVRITGSGDPGIVHSLAALVLY